MAYRRKRTRSRRLKGGTPTRKGKTKTPKSTRLNSTIRRRTAKPTGRTILNVSKNGNFGMTGNLKRLNVGDKIFALEHKTGKLYNWDKYNQKPRVLQLIGMLKKQGDTFVINKIR